MNRSQVGKWSRIVPLLLAVFALYGCSTRTESHAIPDEHVGPVVIVFGVEGGIALDTNAKEIHFQIGAGGVLNVSSPLPPTAGVRARFFYETENGEQIDLPFAVRNGADKLQVFGRSIGSRGSGKFGWMSYLVGVPSDRDDWIRLRDAAVAEAVPRVVIELPDLGWVESPVVSPDPVEVLSR